MLFRLCIPIMDHSSCVNITAPKLEIPQKLFHMLKFSVLLSCIWDIYIYAKKVSLSLFSNSCTFNDQLSQNVHIFVIKGSSERSRYVINTISIFVIIMPLVVKVKLLLLLYVYCLHSVHGLVLTLPQEAWLRRCHCRTLI